jgi:hypothetical protein
VSADPTAPLPVDVIANELRRQSGSIPIGGFGARAEVIMDVLAQRGFEVVPAGIADRLAAAECDHSPSYRVMAEHIVRLTTERNAAEARLSALTAMIDRAVDLDRLRAAAAVQPPDGPSAEYDKVGDCDSTIPDADPSPDWWDPVQPPDSTPPPTVKPCEDPGCPHPDDCFGVTVGGRTSWRWPRELIDRYHPDAVWPDSAPSPAGRYERLWASRRGAVTHLFHPGPGTLDAALCGIVLRAEAWGRPPPTENAPECGRCNALAAVASADIDEDPS